MRLLSLAVEASLMLLLATIAYWNRMYSFIKAIFKAKPTLLSAVCLQLLPLL